MSSGDAQGLEEAMGYRVLTLAELAALGNFRRHHQPRWRQALLSCWQCGVYWPPRDEAVLQRLRNELGPGWLRGYRIGAELRMAGQLP